MCPQALFSLLPTVADSSQACWSNCSQKHNNKKSEREEIKCKNCEEDVDERTNWASYLQDAVRLEASIRSFVSFNTVYLSRTKFSNPDCKIFKYSM